MTHETNTLRPHRDAAGDAPTATDRKPAAAYFLLPLPPGEGRGEGVFAAERRTASAAKPYSPNLQRQRLPTPSPQPSPAGRRRRQPLRSSAAVLASLLACLALPAAAATLKPFTTLTGPVVRLSDLFEAAGLDRPLGPAPAPGSRITVEAAQLAAIARQFGVDWQPASPADRAVLDRPGRSLGRDDVLAPLRAALAGNGAPRDADLELPGFTTPMVPLDSKPSLDVTQLEFDAGTGRFTALLSIAADGVPSAQIRLSGRVQEMVELPVPRRRMLPGDVVLASDLQWTRMNAVLARGEVVRTAAEAVGQALRRPVQPGQPLLLADLGRPVLVTKGMPMLLALDGPGIQLTATGVATEPAGLGERVRVINPASRVVVEAEVTGPGKARVLPGSQPIPAGNAALPRLAAR